jgi:peptidoglycan/LPS O-acetylase OafA/YrhL
MQTGELQNHRIIELDGIRGAAALAVVVAHYFGEVEHGTRALTFGWVGVDVFFVLSGFLIGSIILQQHQRPNFFKSFYLRRAARIVPVYAVVCLVTLTAAGFTAGHAWSDHPYGAGVYSVFGTNFAMTAWGGGGMWLKPTWTLDVEEQFYLVLPLLIYFAPRRWLPALIVGLWSSALLVRIALAPINEMAALTLLPCRADLLLSGVGIALVNHECDLSRFVFTLRVGALVALGATFAAVLVWSTSIFSTWGESLVGLWIAALLLAIINGAPEARHFRSPLLRWCGSVSYALYLVHQPVSGLLHGVLVGKVPDIGTLGQLSVTLLSVAVSVAIAAASWRWLEAPILGWARAYHFSDARLPDREVALQHEA